MAIEPTDKDYELLEKYLGYSPEDVDKMDEVELINALHMANEIIRGVIDGD